MTPPPGTKAHICILKPRRASRQLYGLCRKATEALSRAPFKIEGEPPPKIQIPEARVGPGVTLAVLSTTASVCPSLTQTLLGPLGFLKEKSY